MERSDSQSERIEVPRSLADGADTPNGEGELPEASERRKLLFDFNRTAQPYREDALLQGLFEEQAARTPDAIALEHEGLALSFLELNRRANGLARVLQSYGVGPDRLVGICIARSADAVVALLAVLKAGGAYVPIDPDYPADRIRYLLEDAAPQLVLTLERFTALRQLASMPCIALEGLWTQAAAQPQTDLDPRMSGLASHHLAYVMYTSGSTGRPNGVMVEHRNVVNHWRAIERIYREPDACHRIAVNAPFTFDVSIQQMVMLLSGCTLVLIPEEVRREPSAFLQFLERNRIEGLDCTPSQLNVWISAGLLGATAHALRTVVVGGEAIDAALWARLSEASRVVFYNVYGPTECTVFSTATCLRETSAVPHIGRPTCNAHIYIVDSQQRPVPIGVAGEILIGGAGVARGYLNRPELTGARFITDPVAPERPARVYTTGDIGRWRMDGTIEFIGRNDYQVKIRGYRVELGEIEAQILRHLPVAEAVVLAREDTPGEKQLVAYVTRGPSAVNGALADTERLRSLLAAVLPSHMAPAVFVVMDSFPLMANGKLDRRALPAPAAATPAAAGEPPKGDVEQAVAEIWVDVLRVKRVGRHDKFLELGGHSVQGMRLIVRVAERFSIPMSFPDVFQYPTVSQMAELVTQRQQARAPAQ